MTLERMRPTTRELKIPSATMTADRPVRGGLLKVVVWGGLSERAARLLHQIRLDEHVDVAIEHAVDVAHLLFRAMVLHQLVRMQDVAANLAAERDFLLRA